MNTKALRLLNLLLVTGLLVVTAQTHAADSKAIQRALKAKGKPVLFKQLPRDAQRAVEKSFNLQVKGKTQKSSCAKPAPEKVGSFTQEVRQAGWPHCIIQDGAFGCILNYRWTGCAEVDDGKWECDWDSDQIPSIC